MTTAPDLLPDDLNELRALLLAERARHAAELTAARSRAEEEIARLRQIIRKRRLEAALWERGPAC